MDTDKSKLSVFKKTRRAEWIDENGPCVECGSTKNLEIGSINPKVNVNRNIWKLKTPRYEIELAKCRVYCHRCHLRGVAQEKYGPRRQCRGCKNPTTSSVTAYCSQACRISFNQNAWITRWLNGQENGSSGISTIVVSDRIRRYLHQINKDQCSKCGWSEVNEFTHKVPLEIDHIDGDWRNNKPENLQLLCPNCHALTSNFKSRNKGRGRPWLRRANMKPYNLALVAQKVAAADF